MLRFADYHTVHYSFHFNEITTYSWPTRSSREISSLNTVHAEAVVLPNMEVDNHLSLRQTPSLLEENESGTFINMSKVLDMIREVIDEL